MTILALLLPACVAQLAPPGPAVQPPTMTDGAFEMRDGAALPYRVWWPPGMTAAGPEVVMLALHGFNDSRDAWEIPAPVLAEGGIAVFAPDQRGFGAAPGRGLWPGGTALVDDAAQMAALLHARFPRARLVLMGESMGAAVLMRLAIRADAPPAWGYVLVAPAVWGRAKMNVFLRGSLWLAAELVPGLKLTGSVAGIVASDNRAALIRLSTDPLTIRGTRVDTLRGLVDLMDAALAAAPQITARTLFLYGGKDKLVPPEATAATWRALPAGPDRSFYPNGYHLLLRDHDRARPIGDILAWIADPAATSPSGGASEASAWLAGQD